MNRIFIIGCFSISTMFLFAQKTLVIEGTNISSAITAAWEGVVIPRGVNTTFTYRNNSITSVNSYGYMLQAGDESAGATKNNLDGEIITGNVLTWNGTDANSITHGIFTGYNINALVKYNYLNKVPMGIVRKSNGMTNSSGGVAYNIVKNPLVAVNIKGMNAVGIYNNTFYSNKTLAQTWRGLVHIYSNDSPVAASTGTKVKNNIFYTTHLISNISIEDAACVPGFESDYNIFWCEEGTPRFNYLGATKTFAQWQALGYDTHSVVINPNFINIINFVPRVRLDYGTNLGTTWQSGLSTDATWGKVNPKTSNQNGTWQVGASIYASSIGFPDSNADGIRIYPNPVTHGGILNINLNDIINEPFDLSIYDLSGKLIENKQYDQTNKLSIHLSAYPPAHYLIQIRSDNFHYFNKFTIK